MEQHLKTYIISSKIKALKGTVLFYTERTSFDFEHDVFTKQERVQMAQEKLNSFLQDVKEYHRHGNFELLEIPKHEKAVFIRSYAIEERQKAVDFNQNPFIVIPALKNCVKALRMLVEIYPQLNTYSNHWLSSRNVIVINDNF